MDSEVMDPSKENFSLSSSESDIQMPPNVESENNSPPCSFTCSYCDLTFSNHLELQVHCRSESHQSIIMSDDGREWRYRPPPRGISSEHYTLCQRFVKEGICRLGQQCCEAHSEDELAEWKERFSYRQMKVQRAKEKQLHGNLFSEQLLENWMQAQCPQKIMKENLDYVNLSVSSDLYCTMSSKRSVKDWMFTLNSKVLIHHLALLNDVHRTHFVITAIVCNYLHKNYQKNYDIEYNCQEWTNPDYIPFTENMEFEYKIKISFKTEIFGTFRQMIIFDYGRTPVLAQRLCVDVLPVAELDKLIEMRDTVLSSTSRWTERNVQIVPFEPRPIPLSEEEIGLLTFYSPPHLSKVMVTQAVMDKKLTKENYASRLHELLSIEELAQYEQISRFNMSVKLQLISRYMLAPSTNSVAKYSVNGEMFARMKLNATLSEDTLPGRLVLSNCTMALIALSTSVNDPENEKNTKVYEALIEDKGKNFIYLRLSEQCVYDLNLHADEDLQAEVQFQLNRLPMCEMHYAIDKLPNLNLVFPDVSASPYIPWNTHRQWSDSLDLRLNPKQKEAIVAITIPVELRLPPILLIGPYGTGKTFTLAQAVKQIILQNNTRVLICTHSNSAADLYIKEYFHPYVHQGHTDAHPLRIYYRNRWVQTVHPTVLQYCLLVQDSHCTTFRLPTLEDVTKHRVVVASLSTSRYLAHLGLPKGFFTHILIDEAAQAMECEVIMPLALADADTRIVLAGDHMQLSPEVYSTFAKTRGLHLSLLERLYDAYPPQFSCCILLCENYRSHDAIIQYTSELFYDNKLLASGKQPRHEVFYPLTFFTARGEDIHDQNSTAFYNNSEVYEIVERVCELQKMWPKSWGKQDESSIGIVTPYADQVFRIRAEFRKRRMAGVSVERVLNVQGKQFRAVFLSTVRTRHTCSSQDDSEELVDYGFLSNAKLLNTAITRAQSLVAVVGDPISLCSIGKCRKLWERFIEVCHEHKSLHGITWSSIRAQLDGVELKKTYVLNPLAPEFIPNRLRHGEPYVQLNSYIGPQGHVFCSSPTWFNTRYYYSSHLYPPSAPMYSYPYPVSYLYGLRPSYVGTPVMLNSMNVPNWNLNLQGSGKRNLFYCPSVNQMQDKGNDFPKRIDKEENKCESPKKQPSKDYIEKGIPVLEKAPGVSSPSSVLIKGNEGRGFSNGIQPDILKGKKGKLTVLPTHQRSGAANFIPERRRSYTSPEDKFVRNKDWDWKDKQLPFKKHSKTIDVNSWQKNSLHVDTNSVNKQYQFLPGVHLPESSSSSTSSTADQASQGSRKHTDDSLVKLPQNCNNADTSNSQMNFESEETPRMSHLNMIPLPTPHLHSDENNDFRNYNLQFRSVQNQTNAYHPLQKIIAENKSPPFLALQNCASGLNLPNSNEAQPLLVNDYKRIPDHEWMKTPAENIHPPMRNISYPIVHGEPFNQQRLVLNSNAWKMDVPEVSSLLPLSGMTVKELEANLPPEQTKLNVSVTSTPNMLSENSSWISPKDKETNLFLRRESIDYNWIALKNQIQSDNLPLYLRCSTSSESQKLPSDANMFHLNNTFSKNLTLNEPDETPISSPRLPTNLSSEFGSIDNSKIEDFAVQNNTYLWKDLKNSYDSPPQIKTEVYENGFLTSSQAPLTYAGVVRATGQKQTSPSLESVIKETNAANAFNKQGRLYKYFY